jgi:hypothetical protein
MHNIFLNTGQQRVQRLLLSYLEATHTRFWPGADGMIVEDVLLDYPRAAARGEVPSLPDLLARHADLADELAAFMAKCGAKPAKGGEKGRS